jgi:hypothetical protein
MVHKFPRGVTLSSNAKGAVYGIAGANFSTNTDLHRTADPFINNTLYDYEKCHALGKDAKGNTYGKDADKGSSILMLKNVPHAMPRIPLMRQRRR